MKIMIDNIIVVFVINNMGICYSDKCNLIVVKFWEFCMLYNIIWFIVVYILSFFLEVFVLLIVNGWLILYYWVKYWMYLILNYRLMYLYFGLIDNFLYIVFLN